MPLPRRIWVSPLVALFSAGFTFAFAQDRGDGARPAAGRQQASAPQPAMDMAQLLRLWEGQSAKLQTLELAIYRVDEQKAWGDVEHYQGHAAFKAPQLAFLDFRKVKMQEQPDPKDKKKKVLAPVKKNNKIESIPYETIVCTGPEVWHYRYDVKQIYIFPLDKDQRKRALEEGPLPFLFNMRADDAQRRYKMELQLEDETRYLVRVYPRLKEDQESFSVAWVYLDKKFLLPKRIYLLAPDKKSSKDFNLSEIRANQQVDPKYFVGVTLGKGWKVERNPGGPAPAAPANAKAPRRQQADQAAQRTPAPAGQGQPR
jgi:TIGR03009 family protein